MHMPNENDVRDAIKRAQCDPTTKHDRMTFDEFKRRFACELDAAISEARPRLCFINDDVRDEFLMSNTAWRLRDVYWRVVNMNETEDER